MDFEQSAKSRDWMERVRAFMEEHIAPAVPLYHSQSAAIDRWTEIPPIFDELKDKAQAAGLWNIFMPPSEHDDEFFTSVGLTNVEYAPIAELMGRVSFATEVFNCMAPDTGNFEVLHRYGTPAQKERFMVPLRDGLTRSAFLMTEPDVASSDATNITTELRREGEEYVINGRKWWSSGAGHPKCDFLIVMGKTDPDNPNRHQQQSQILVPMNTPGVNVKRPMMVLGSVDAPEGHAEVIFENVRVPKENIILGEGRGFEIAQGRLGPGRIHHCMRLIGAAQRALELMCKRANERMVFGQPMIKHGSCREDIAKSACEIEQARLMTLKAADTMDRYGNKEAKELIAMIKIVAPNMALNVVDRAMQIHGAVGLSQDTPLAGFFAYARTLRLADGPDQVHMMQLGRNLAKKYE
ncbi:MAG TPA: acyl-CoA dehydrogenase [Alcanivorax sp.]|nr:acyl-CoA dehydrogenase [Alcanivorax sp.]